MAGTNFSFLAKEFPILFNIATAAEYNLYTDPATTLWKLRVFEEKIVDFLFEEHGLERPYNDTLHTRILLLEDERIIQPNIASLIHSIKHKGNAAVHDSRGTVEDAKTILFSAFKVAKWFYQSYSTDNHNIADLKFSMPPNLDARHALNEL